MNLLISLDLVLLLLLYTSFFNKPYHVFIFFVSIKSWGACFFNINFWKLPLMKFKLVFSFIMRMCRRDIRRTWINSFLFDASHRSKFIFIRLRSSSCFDEIIFVSSLRSLFASIRLGTILMMNTLSNIILRWGLLSLTHHIYTLTWKLDHMI